MYFYNMNKLVLLQYLSYYVNTFSFIQVGDRVYTGRTQTGSCAEYTVAEEAHTHLLHENLNFSQGATLGTPYYTAYRALITRYHSLL